MECSPPNTCHMSHATCPVSGVWCHTSFFLDKVLVLVCGGSFINGAYSSILPLLEKLFWPIWSFIFYYIWRSLDILRNNLCRIPYLETIFVMHEFEMCSLELEVCLKGGGGVS